MNYLVSIIFVALVTVVSSQYNPSESRQLRRRHKEVRVQKEEKTGVDCTLVLSETQFEDREEEEQWECYVEPSAIDPKSGGHYIDVNVNFGADYKDDKVGVVESGFTRLTSEHAIISQSKAVLVDPPTLSKSPAADSRRRLSAITGERKVLIVRVTANDSVTSASKAVLAREILGIKSDDGETDGFNLATGFRDCSYNKLTFVPTDYSKAKNGVYSVKINTNVVNKKFTEVRNIVLDQLRSDFSMNNLNDFFDHVMICMPHGTVSNNGNSKWAAYGIVNGYVTIFNDNWCTSVSAQMHEVGHNLGLRHSGEKGKSAYDDKSGMLGHSYFVDERPRQCFNSAKSWQLGWYKDKHTTIRLLDDQYWQGRLIGLTDYQNISAPKDASVIVKIEGHNLDYFIGFNLKAGINRENQEENAQNKVTVHSVGIGGGESLLEGKLGIGESFRIENFGAGDRDAFIQVNYINMNANPPEASVSVNLVMCTSDVDCQDGDQCTVDACNLSTGTCQHTPKDSCLGTMKMTLLTDRYPEETSWKIVDNCANDSTVMKGSGYDKKFSKFVESEKLPVSRYTLQVDDKYGDGICCGQGRGMFIVSYNDQVVAFGGKFKKSEIVTWGTCSS